MSFFDDWNWDNIGNAFEKTLVPAVTSYFGAQGVNAANARAAQIARDNAAQNEATIAAANAPALQYLSTVMARNPNVLTPEQAQQIRDASRVAVTATPTGLRGSGRYMTASINDIRNRMKQGMITTNTARADRANAERAALAGGVGRQLVGENTGGNYATANAGTATAGSNNAALQNIGSYFASSLKGASSPYPGIYAPGMYSGQYGYPGFGMAPQRTPDLTLKAGGV